VASRLSRCSKTNNPFEQNRSFPTGPAALQANKEEVWLRVGEGTGWVNFLEGRSAPFSYPAAPPWPWVRVGGVPVGALVDRQRGGGYDP